jgi:hypothetical protein
MGLVSRYSSLRKFMYVTACYTSSRHNVAMPRALLVPMRAEIYGILQTNFGEFMVYEVG